MRFRVAVFGALALIGGLALGQPQQAQAGTVSYALAICEDLNVLENPGDPMAQMMAAWKTQSELLVERNQPYIELKNTSDTASITHFRMTIGDTSQNFDLVQFLAASSSPGVSITNVTPDTVQNGAKGDFIDFDIVGLTPGKFLRFRVDIDPDSSNQPAYSDYRTVLFDMNGASTADNSQVTIKYHDPPGADVTHQNLLPDFAMTMPTVVGVAFRTPYSMDHVTAFTLADPQGGPVVPEPSSLSLLAVGMGAGLFGLRWRKRRSG
jgi:hypothetical protein